MNSVLGGYVGEYGTQQVQFNLRQDRYSDFGTANTGLLGYGLSFADHWRATAIISNAFKAPTFNDMYCSVLAWCRQSESAAGALENKEIGLHYAAGVQHADLVYFDNRIHDLINYPAPQYVAQNIDRAQIDGIELGYTGEFGDTHLKANATWQNPRDTATGQCCCAAPNNMATSGCRSLSVHGRPAGNGNTAVRARMATSIHSRRSLCLAYQVVNLDARYHMDKNISMSARIDNLFNRDYMLVDGYNTLGRTLFVGVNYQQ